MALSLAIIMPTIRFRAERTARAIVEDLLASQIDLSNVSIYFSAGHPLRKPAHSQIMLDYPTLKAVKYLDARDRMRLAGRLERELGLTGSYVNAGLARPGYAAARNAATLLALHDSNDVAIYVDDDAVPLVPTGRNGSLAWRQALFIRPHLDEIASGAQVTVGHHLGYNSPLVDLRGVLSETCLMELGLALSLGNEVLEPDSLALPKPVLIETIPTTITPAMKSSAPSTIVISGGNLGISLDALGVGRIPPFYCPDQARGEDTFFGALLDGQVKIAQTKSVLFHDPFALIDNRRDEALPSKLPEFAQPTPNNMSRFATAFLGWLRYAPLWITLKAGEPLEHAERLHEIRLILTRHTHCLTRLSIDNALEVFDCACADVPQNLQVMSLLDTAWRKKIAPTCYQAKNT